MRKLILIRHAERPEIAPNEVGNDVVLTEQGKQDTTQYAKSISGQVVSMMTSPIERCIETAEIIAKENGFPFEQIERSRLLGNPGFVIEDGKIAWQQWQTKGHDVVNQHLLSATDALPGFADFETAVNAFLNNIATSLADEASEGLHVWVTHDVMLATLASRTLPNNLTLADWPHFLGHLIVTLEETGELSFEYLQKP
ncbi:histidine phosphatase family protein [Vibrio agarivorans]|uniref:histidine phosphatase family protein n=1 Tax=Vibrio agarivorans TaxID=153622 RepID=UPI0025B2AE24|nr:histidine phosphatase family protein [Vibrio agarivorans]MDN3663156.1 histidine phosphatase family protein [Vibrio agarivorans]